MNINTFNSSYYELIDIIKEVVWNWRIGNDYIGLIKFKEFLIYFQKFLNEYQDDIDKTNTFPSMFYEILNEINIATLKKDLISICDLLEIKVIPTLDKLKRSVNC